MPTGSPSCIAVASSASCRRTPREVLGLMMAGVPTEEALASASMTTLAEEDAALEASLEEVPHES